MGAPGTNKRLTVSFVNRGHTDAVEVEVPDTSDALEDQRTEAAHFVQTLADNGDLEGPRARYQIVTKPDGTRALERRSLRSRLDPHR